MDRVPSEGLEDEVVAALKARGAIGARPGRVQRWGVRAAAAGVLFFAGWSAAQMTMGDAGSALGAPLGEQYMLLIWEGPEFQPDQNHAEEYGAWGLAVDESGIPITGHELGSERRVFGPSNLAVGDAPVEAGPPPEYRLVGYFMVAAGEGDAVRLARDHPHRRYGGWVEVAPVVVR